MSTTLKNFLAIGLLLLTFSACKKDNKRPKADFTFTTSDWSVLPVIISTNNKSTGQDLKFNWTAGNSSSTETNPNFSYSTGGVYDVKLVVTGSEGIDSVTKQVRVTPYAQPYSSFNGTSLNLFGWEGRNVTILSRNANLNRSAMAKWVKAMDTTYGYYKLITGLSPKIKTTAFINERATLADVPSTCGPAGCGSFGSTGVEFNNAYFDIIYNALNSNDQHDQGTFYEFARNFWFYGDKLSYKNNDPITDGYAVFMRFMAMDAAGVNGAPYGAMSFPAFKLSVENLINSYLSDQSLNWANTLGVNKGVPNSGLDASDLFASFCFRLKRDYGGDTFVKNLWKQAGLRPNANTTQEAVDNFFLAACAAANKNLTTLFQTWRWTISASATTAASKYP